MSNFYHAMELNKEQNMQFKAMKKEFKRGQPCKNCGKKLAMHKMTVDHIIPVSDPSVDPFDMLNWQVLCLPCHREKTHKENLARHQAKLNWRPPSMSAAQEHQNIKEGRVT